MTLGQTFPRTAAAFPRLINWNANFAWASNFSQAAVQAFNNCQINCQQNSDTELFRFSELLREDLTQQTALIKDEPSAAMIDSVRFIIAQPAIFRALATGKHGDCYHWTLWAISRNHNFNARINHSEYRLPPFQGASAEMNENALAFAVDWVKCAYTLARKFGGLDNLAQDFFDDSCRIAIRAVDRGDVQSGLEAIVAIVNWATNVGHPEAERLTRMLLEIYKSRDLNPRLNILIGMLFVTAAGYWTDKSPVSWAREMLSRYRHQLVEHETVQLLAATIDSAETWAERRMDILSETRRLANSYRVGSQTKLGDKVSFESRVSILHPVIYGLSRFGSTEDLMELLWAWYGRDDWERADNNILFVSPNHGDGVGFVWPGGRWFAPSTATADTLEGMVVAISHALNEYLRGPSGDRDLLFDERLVGAPALEHGPILLSRMEEHYCLTALKAQLPEGFRPRSILVMPSLRDPLQAILAQSLGWLAPLETSLAKPDELRRFTCLSVWPGATQLTEVEVAALETIGKLAGWQVKTTRGVLDEAAFRNFYQDPDADILWVIGHGEQSPFRVEETGLIMEEDKLLPLPHIADLKIPRCGRRLLVLNVCSGAAAQNLGGLASVGLAQELVSPQQQVVAHLWPIDYYAALAFGCAFASQLIHKSPAEALANSFSLIRNQAALLSEIRAISSELEALTRLSGNRVSEHLDSVLSWGCPVLLT